MSSIYGLVGGVDRVGYVTTKTVLIGLDARRGAGDGGHRITCNAICAGTTMTPNIAGRIEASMARTGWTARRRWPPPRRQEPFRPHRRGPSAVGAMAAFLCGEAGRDITGTALPMDGGWSAA